MTSAPSQRSALAVFLILLGVYLATSSFRVETIDTGVRLEVARALVRTGSPEIRPIEMRTPFGIVGSFPGPDGRRWSVYGLGQSLLLLPAARFGPPWDAGVATLVNPLLTAATGALLVLVAGVLGFSRRTGIRLGLFFGVGTLAWPQAVLTFEAPIEAAALVAAVFLLLRGGTPRIAAAGAVLGFAVLTRPSALVMLPGLAWLLLDPGIAPPRTRGRRVIAFVVGAAPFAFAVLAYNQVRWGDPFASGYALTSHRYFQLSGEGLIGLVASPGRGFFWFSPVLLLSLVGFTRWFRNERSDSNASESTALRRAVGRGALVLCASYLTFLSFLTVWNGDWTWGPRHALPLVPVAALGMLPVLEPGGFRRAIVVPLLIVSIFVQLVGATSSFDSYYVWHNERMRRTGVREIAGRYHFDMATAQIPVQARLAAAAWRELPERWATFRDGRFGGPYDPILEGPPHVTSFLPDVWWIYLPLVRAPAAAIGGVAIACLATVGFGVALLRRSVSAGRPPPGSSSPPRRTP